jgi:hypothetical protein
MSDKSKKFNPSAGFVVAVHMNKLGIRAVADELDMHPEILADAMDRAGFQLIADPFNLTSDAGKVIQLEERQKTAGLQIVPNAEEEQNDGE